MLWTAAWNTVFGVSSSALITLGSCFLSEISRAKLYKNKAFGRWRIKNKNKKAAKTRDWYVFLFLVTRKR